ncbi:MAG: metallophosphoesterase [Anaerolinea sp.]|nr:metallophosphoesterase [Anaerolinea sp.]
MSESHNHNQPLENSRLHKILVGTNKLQQIPAFVVAIALAVCAGIAALTWVDQGSGALIFLGALIGMFGNWYLLWRLPRKGMSFGVDQPTALALAALITLVTLIVGILNIDALFALLLIGAITLVAYYATWIEPFRLGVTPQTFTRDDWRVPVTLLHISDIHVERITERERKLNRLINLLKPDVIVFTGDFVNLSYTGDPHATAAIREIIGEWRAPLGVYCVPGTPVVEPLPLVREFVAGLDNLTLLLNEWHTVETAGGRLHLLGLITTHDLETDRAALRNAMTHAPEGGIRLLITHSPDIAPEAGRAGIDWYLCGHTHGGQIRLPIYGALMSSSQLGMKYVMGRYDVNGMTLYVSRGIGMEGYGAPRARFLCPPEVILWRITPSSI